MATGIDAHRLVEANTAVLEAGIDPDHEDYDLALNTAYRMLERREAIQRLTPNVDLNEEALYEAKWIGSLKTTTFKKDVLGILHGTSAFWKPRRALTAKERRKLARKLKKAEREINSTIRRFQGGTVNSRLLYSKTKKILKDAYTEAYQRGLNASGLKDAMQMSGQYMAEEDKRFVNSAYKQEMGYWNTFLGEVVRGKDAEKTIRTKERVHRYIQSLGSMFDAARVVSLPPNVVIHWLLEDRNACPDCQTIHAASPFTKRTLVSQPKGGLTRCLDNCRCRLKFVTAKDANAIERIEKRHKTPARLIRKIQADKKKSRGARRALRK